MSIVVKITFIGLVNVTGKCVIFTARNIKRCAAAATTATSSAKKNVLIDTVDHKFSREFVQNLRNEIDLADIDYIVINHAEEDHAGR